MAPKMRHPDFLECTVCESCDLATANERMSLLIMSFVSEGTASSKASSQTLLTAIERWRGTENIIILRQLVVGKC